MQALIADLAGLIYCINYLLKLHVLDIITIHDHTN